MADPLPTAEPLCGHSPQQHATLRGNLHPCIADPAEHPSVCIRCNTFMSDPPDICPGTGNRGPCVAAEHPSLRFDHDGMYRHHHDADTAEPVWWENVEDFGGEKRHHIHHHAEHPSGSPQTEAGVDDPNPTITTGRRIYDKGYADGRAAARREPLDVDLLWRAMYRTVGAPSQKRVEAIAAEYDRLSSIPAREEDDDGSQYVQPVPGNWR